MYDFNVGSYRLYGVMPCLGWKIKKFDNFLLAVANSNESAFLIIVCVYVFIFYVNGTCNTFSKFSISCYGYH